MGPIGPGIKKMAYQKVIHVWNFGLVIFYMYFQWGKWGTLLAHFEGLPVKGSGYATVVRWVFVRRIPVTKLEVRSWSGSGVRVEKRIR